MAHDFFGGRNNRTIRAVQNPLDVSTVVSVYHGVIRETRPTCSPGYFLVPPGTPEKPSVLTVGSSSWWHSTNPDQPAIEVTNSSVQMAESVVRDWANGLLGANAPDVMPGVFWVPGRFTSEQILKQFPGEIAKAVAKQNRWYQALVNLADATWARSGGNPMAITNDMREAAQSLGLSAKDWMQNFTAMSQERCMACGTLKDPNYPVCPACKAIDKNHPKAKDLKFAVG